MTNLEPTPFDDVEMPERSGIELLAMLLEEILAEVKRGNSIERTGAVSSAQIETTSKGLNCSVKAYAGSVVPVHEALEAYGRLFREANARAMNGWSETVAGLEQKESAS